MLEKRRYLSNMSYIASFPKQSQVIGYCWTDCCKADDSAFLLLPGKHGKGINSKTLYRESDVLSSAACPPRLTTCCAHVEETRKINSHFPIYAYIYFHLGVSLSIDRQDRQCCSTFIPSRTRERKGAERERERRSCFHPLKKRISLRQ